MGKKKTSRLFSVEFKGFDEVSKRIQKLDGDIVGITEKALKATHADITPKIKDAMRPHNRRGHRTYDTIVEEANVVWEGTQAHVKVGFDIGNGGLASVFLMYGTPYHSPNNSGVIADKKLYNSIYGSSTTNRIRKLQEDIFYEELRKLEG